MVTVTEVMINVVFGNQVVITAQPGNLSTNLPSNALVVEILQKTLSAVQNGDPSIDLNANGRDIVPSPRMAGKRAPARVTRSVSGATAGGSTAKPKRGAKRAGKAKADGKANIKKAPNGGPKTPKKPPKGGRKTPKRQS
jgi:hypothetical protein